MSKQNKITVKHYLNDKLKADRFSEEKLYPIYVRVSFLRKNFRFRSLFLQEYYSDSDFDIIENKTLMNYESEMITFAIQKNENIEDLTSYLYLLKYNIIHILKLYILTEDGFSNSKFYELLNTEIKEIISNKANINKESLACFIKIDREIDNKFFTFFDENLLRNEELKNAILFIKSILTFAEIEFKERGLNCYEWKYKNGKAKFLEFLNKNDSFFEKHISLIDSYISWSEDSKE